MSTEFLQWPLPEFMQAQRERLGSWNHPQYRNFVFSEISEMDSIHEVFLLWLYWY